jgi:hypothetical protein
MESLWEMLKKSVEKSSAQAAAENAPVSYEPLTNEQMQNLRWKSLYDQQGKYKGSSQ